MAGWWENLSSAPENRLFQSIQSEQEFHDMEKQNEKALHEINVKHFKWEALSNIGITKKVFDWSSLYLSEYGRHRKIASFQPNPNV